VTVLAIGEVIIRVTESARGLSESDTYRT